MIRTTISYSTPADTAVTFSASDFNSVCYSETGNYLNYVKFSLPSSYYGTLYYSTSSSSTYNKGRHLEHESCTGVPYRISITSTFVPSSSYTGTVTITYTGYSTAGTSYTGYVTVTVGDTEASDSISYTTDQNTAVTFSASDFNSVCYSTTGYYLSGVKFTLPSSYYGKLYYNYTSSGEYTAAVSSGTSYYKSASPYLSYVCFVPSSSYTGDR